MAKKEDNTDFLTVLRAAKEIGVHFTTLYRWIESDKVSCLRFGGILFVPASEVRRLRVEESNGKGGELATKRE